MINFTIPDEVQDVIASLEKFVEKEIVPLEKQHEKALHNERFQYDERGLYTEEIQQALREVRMRSAKAGFFSMFGPSELGGYGDNFGPLAAALIHEALIKKFGPGLFIREIFPPGLFTGGLTPVLLGMRPEVREKVLPQVASGESLLCFGLSEPDAGTDVWNIKTRAVQDGDHWVINGAKQWITNAPYADYALIFAVTNPALVALRQGGITCFLVPIDGKDCSCNNVDPYLGSVGSRIGIITLEDVRVHESYIVGDIDDAFGKAMGGIDVGRLILSSYSVGIAQWAVDKTLEYAKQRKTFGKALVQHQAVASQLADCAIEIYAARNMVLNCAWKMENQKELPLKEISMTKVFATEMANRVLDRCMQIHGGIGLTNELKLEYALRWIRPMRIVDGNSEILRQTVAKQMLKGK